MRILTKLVAGAAAAAAAVAVAAGPAMADPPSGVTPKPANVVGVGSDTIQNVFDQFSHDFNATHTKKLYSWDATNPKTGAIHDLIQLKSGSATCKIPRPDGSTEGITALTSQNGTTGGHPCIDFARSSRDRASTDPTNISFVDLAGDAVTYATQATTNAPGNLSTAQLKAIYLCRVTNWNQVGGKNAKIKAVLPQSGSGTFKFFIGAIGVTTPGPCVIQPSTLEENEGVNPVLKSPNVIFPFSVGKYIAERYHSAKCLNSSCTPVGGVVCKPKAGQNLFGCDTHGTMTLNKVNGTAPTKPFPLTNTTTKAVINPGFSATFQRIVFEVVKATAGSIPAYLKPFFGPTGWVCTNTKAKTDLKNYGFRVLPAGTAAGQCGSAH